MQLSPRIERLPRIGPKAFLRITQVTLGLIVLNVVTGAAVRLTDSGLGCPDWPTCSKTRITPPLSFHPAMEFGNRMVVVLLCVTAAIAFLASLLRQPRRRDLTLFSGGLVCGIVAEALIGAVVVYSKLNPYAVMTHFMVGIGLLTVAWILALKAGRAPGGGTTKVGGTDVLLARVAMGLLLLAIVAGTATTGAGPHAGGPGAKRIPVPLADMARTHSGIVLVTAALVLALLYLLEHNSAPESVRRRGRLLLGAMVAQGIVGYTQYFTHLPPLLVGIHVFGATVVWGAMCWFVDGLWHHSPEMLLAATEDRSQVGNAERTGGAVPVAVSR